MFFPRCSKFSEDFENAIRYGEKLFGFLDNCIPVAW